MKNEYLLFLMYTGMSIELLTALLGTLYFKKYKNTKLHNFIYFIWYIAINEIITGLYLKKYLRIEEANFLYNIFFLVNFLFYFLLFNSFIVNKRYRITINVFIFIYIGSLIVNGFYQNYLTEIQFIPNIIASSFLIIAIVFYYIEILKSEKVLRIEKNLLFWISIGVLIYNIGRIPFRILTNYYTNLVDDMVPFLATFILTIIMNLCFIIGFIWSDRKQLY